MGAGKFYRILIQLLATPIFLSGFFAGETGQEYGVSFWKKRGYAGTAGPDSRS